MPRVEAMNVLEPGMQKLSDEQLRAKTDEFRRRVQERLSAIPDEPDADPDRIKQLEEERTKVLNEALEEVLVDAFAVVREAGRRVLNMRHFDVQLIGGMVLHQGKIAEMKTGEGKTLVATLPVYLNALSGRGVHVVTVNDYLAKRDSEWMGKLYRFLGLSVGVIVHDLDDEERREAYAADVTYGTNNEFGFDYLRDNTVTDEGWEKVEGLLGIGNIADPENWDLKHHVETAVKAHALYRRDVEYVVKDGEAIIVDEFTGRLMPGRRWSDGLHQAVEAKESVRIERENQTLATITFQNYFRMYEKLAGMTGTAETEAEEFAKIYKLDVTVIPTNQPLVRVNLPDVVYKTEREKFNAAVEDIIERNTRGQPVLVGTVSIEKSEQLSKLLKKRGIRHEVLNAKYHEREAEIVAQAGREGSVTIATNMAGRGTDILLGGNPDFLSKEILRKKGLDPATAAPGERTAALGEARRITEPEHARVVALGGLHILGTERHEARRVDNQLRGRSGRQGDPGSSRFYLSLEDDLLRIFGSHRIQKIMERLGMEEGEPIEHKLVTRAIATAQKRVETHNFEIRKHLLEYDDVMNKQREIIYGMRRQILDGESQADTVSEWIDDLVSATLETYAAESAHPDDWDLAGLGQALGQQFDVRIAANRFAEVTSRVALEELVAGAVKGRYAERERDLGGDLMRALERHEMLLVIDTQW